MDFGDFSSRMKAVRDKQNQGVDPDKPYDYQESYRLRGKMLGVLIRDARINASRTIDDCARLLRIPSEVVESWEYGDVIPDLPQLELLAYYLDVPISHFWGQKTMESPRETKVDAQSEYMALRHRMIGALLRKAREEAGLSIEEIGAQAFLSVEQVQAYELGEQAIPMHELTVLSNAVNKNVDYFLESSGYIGELLQIREEWKHFLDLDGETRQFVANPLNLGFIEIAMLFSKMPTDKLRKVAEGMLEITM